jgi:hypothetical protein
MKIKKVISGGQTGVDIAALKVAQNLNIDTGGWAPPELQNEAGKIPAFYNLHPTPNEHSSEAPNIGRSQRTEWNVRDSDGTLVILPQKEFSDPGTSFTIQIAKRLEKPFFIIFLDKEIPKYRFGEWLIENQIQILNIAGPAESSFNRIESMSTEAFEILLLDNL